MVGWQSRHADAEAKGNAISKIMTTTTGSGTFDLDADYDDTTK
jgi:hypothetical protein